MKTILVVAFGAMVLSAMALLNTNPPPSVTFAWDPSIESNVTYRVYWGPASRVYTGVVQVATTSVSISFPRGATNWVSATTVATNLLESDLSNELLYVSPLPPPPPANLRITVSQ